MEHHHEDDDDDLLALLLSYQCPVTGRKRVAGSYPVDTRTNKPKFLGCTAVILCFTIGYLGIYVLAIVPSKLRFKETDLDEKAFLSLRPSSSPVSACTVPVGEATNDESYDDYFNRGMCSDDSNPSQGPQVLPASAAIAKETGLLAYCNLFLMVIQTLTVVHNLSSSKKPYMGYVPSTKESSVAKVEYLARVGDTSTAEGFDWQSLKSVGLLYHCQRSENILCGKLLKHCKNQVSSLREKIGIRICCFKIGITSNPPLRFASYMEKNFNCMWVIAVSNSIDRISMLEAAVISEFQKHVGCKNEPDTGGEGALNRKTRAEPPYYLYVTAGKADQARWVG